MFAYSWYQAIWPENILKNQNFVQFQKKGNFHCSLYPLTFICYNSITSSWRYEYISWMFPVLAVKIVTSWILLSGKSTTLNASQRSTFKLKRLKLKVIFSQRLLERHLLSKHTVTQGCSQMASSTINHKAQKEYLMSSNRRFYSKSLYSTVILYKRPRGC